MSKHPYQALKTREFRLLTLQPSSQGNSIQLQLRHVKIADKPDFSALSYEWGPPSSDDPQVYVDEHPFTIRHNLWLFLTRLRAYSTGPQSIYADAICINQNDTEEKARQVVLMSEIYTSAKKVLVWLGEHDQYSRTLFESGVGAQIDKMPKGVKFLPCLLPVTLPLAIMRYLRRTGSGSERVAAWTSLLSRPYWNRTWIVQEFLLAQSVVIFCGSDHMNGDTIFERPFADHFSRKMRKNQDAMDGVPRSFLLFFWKTSQKRKGNSSRALERRKMMPIWYARNQALNRQLFSPLESRGKAFFPNADIFELACNFQYTECQMILDHVYGLLALEDPSTSPPFKPNYNISAPRLFVDLCMMKLPMASGNATMIADKGMSRVVMLFRGLKLTFDDAEAILDILLSDEKAQIQNKIVIATITRAFDIYGLLKPERKEWICPRGRTSESPEHIIAAVRQWQASQKQNHNWYNIHGKKQIHDSRGLPFMELDEPLWSHYTVLRSTQRRRNMQNIQQTLKNQAMQNNDLNIALNSFNAITTMGGGGA